MEIENWGGGGKEIWEHCLSVSCEGCYESRCCHCTSTNSSFSRAAEQQSEPLSVSATVVSSPLTVNNRSNVPTVCRADKNYTKQRR